MWMKGRGWATILLVAGFLIAVLILPAGAAPKVIVDGVRLNPAVPPVVEQGVVLVPARDIFEALGAGVSWDGATKSVHVRKGDTHIRLQIGSTRAFVNGTAVPLAVPPRTVNGAVMVPLRFVSESLEAEVRWNGLTRTVTVFSGAAASEEAAPSVTPRTPGTIDREYSWDYGGKRWTYRLQVPREAYEYYTGLKRPPTDNYSVYVTDPVDDPFIAAMAARFLEVARQERYSPKQTVEFVVAFVQSLEYVTDDISKGFDQYARYPLETLVEQEGDCEDTSILLASILREMDFGVVLVMLPGDPGHMAVGVKGENLPGVYYEYAGARYYYVETTAAGWSIGRIPDEYRHREARILPLVPQAVITHEWVSRGSVSGYIELKVTVHNYGTVTARETKVYAALDAGGGKVYDQRWSGPLNLEPRARGTYTLRLKPPANVETRLIVKIVSDGYLVDESTSERFRT